MREWSEGYVSELDYTYGYYHDLNPSRSVLPLIKAGIKPPQIRTACELGFGQGVAINVHAAASSVEWFGTDVNPSQVNFARELAKTSGASCFLFDQSFDEFCRRTDLPDFDFIGLHGVWSWISKENREILRQFISKKLRVGGLLYVSYNTLPGWAQMLPFRDLLFHHVSVTSSQSESLDSRIGRSITFMDEILGVQPFLAKSHPIMVERFKKSKGLSRNYLAHEYFNRDWHPSSFIEVSSYFQEAKLSYAGSSHYLDHIDVVNLTEDQLRFLASIHDPILQEATRDFISGQPFRRDYWVKGPVRLNVAQQTDLLRECQLVLARPKGNLKLKIKGLRGEGNLDGQIYRLFIEAIPDRGIPFSLGEIADNLRGELSLAELVQATFCFAAKGDLLPLVNSDSLTKKAQDQCRNLNNAMITHSLAGSEAFALASPRLAGGFELDRIHQVFLKNSVSANDETEIIRLSYKDLQKNGKQLLRDGEPVSHEASILELEQHYERFKANQALYEELGIL